MTERLRWWRERTGLQRLTFAWAALAVVATLVREQRRRTGVDGPAWRPVGQTIAGEPAFVDAHHRPDEGQWFGARIDGPAGAVYLTVRVRCAPPAVDRVLDEKADPQRLPVALADTACGRLTGTPPSR